MSYCRWSSMNWMCDVYVYADVSGGWTTIVASRRRAIPPIPDLLIGSLSRAVSIWSGAEWDKETRKMVYPSKFKKVFCDVFYSVLTFWHSKVHMGSLNLIPLRDIGLPHDGESFNDDMAIECANRLENLRRIGYKVPQYAIDDLRSEEL